MKPWIRDRILSFFGLPQEQQMSKVYIASSLFNSDRVKELAKILISHGVTISYDWTVHGQVFDEDELNRIGELEADGVLNANVLFFLHPGRSGSHVELGMAIAMAKLGHNMTIVMLEEQPVEQKTFYCLDCVNRFNDLDNAVNFTLRTLGIV